MALYTKPSLEQALAIVEDIVAQRKRWGAQAGAGQYSIEQLTQAIVVLYDESNVDGPSKADLTTANRRVAASGAREAGLKKQLAEALAAQVWGMYLDEVPVFYQGTDTLHELAELVTAQEVTGYVNRITELAARLQETEAKLAQATYSTQTEIPSDEAGR